MYEPRIDYSPEEYQKINESDPYHKYEYINGYIRMMTGDSVPHGEIGGNVITALNVALRESECHVYSSDVAVNLAERRYYYPDVSVSCDPHDWARTKALEAPTVVVEVLSPGTERIDAREKLDAYRQYPTIQEILLIRSRKRHVEHHHRVVDSAWQKDIFEHDDDVIELASIEVSLTLHDIYHKVYLEIEEEQANR